MASKRWFILAASCVALIGGLTLATPTVPAHADGPNSTPTRTPASGGSGGSSGNGMGGGGHGGGT